MRQLQIVGGHVVEQHQPHRRHAGGMRHLLGVEQFVDRGAVELGAGHHQLGAHRGRGEGDAPAVGVEQRHHRQHGVGGIGAERIAGVGHQRMQHVGAVRIQHALGIAGGAGGVAHRGRGILVKGLPLELAVGFRDPVLVGDRVLQRGLRHVRLVGEHDVALDARQLVGDLFQDRHEGDVGHHHAVLRMIDDPGDLVREQARIDGMADRADPHDAVPGFQMAPGVPGDGGDAVAELDAVAVQPLRDFQRAIVNFGVIGAMNRAFDRPRDDLLRSMISRRVFDNPVAQQRPILHQAKHTHVPPGSSRLSLTRLAGLRGPAIDHGIDMNSSAEKASRKWTCGAFGRTAKRQWLPLPPCCVRHAGRAGDGGAPVRAGPAGATCSVSVTVAKAAGLRAPHGGAVAEAAPCGGAGSRSPSSPRPTKAGAGRDRQARRAGGRPSRSLRRAGWR